MLYSFVAGPDSPMSFCEQLLRCAGDDLSNRVDARQWEDVAHRSHTADALELVAHQRSDCREVAGKEDMQLLDFAVAAGGSGDMRIATAALLC